VGSIASSDRNGTRVPGEGVGDGCSLRGLWDEALRCDGERRQLPGHQGVHGGDGDDEKTYGRSPKIDNTCASCAKALREVVTKTANEIVERHRPAVEALRAEVKAQRERQAKFERDKAQFERDWAEKQRTMEER
jgi:hypothetical protein